MGCDCDEVKLYVCCWVGCTYRVWIGRLDLKLLLFWILLVWLVATNNSETDGSRVIWKENDTQVGGGYQTSTCQRSQSQFRPLNWNRGVLSFIRRYATTSWNELLKKYAPNIRKYSVMHMHTLYIISSILYRDRALKISWMCRTP